MKRFKLPIQTFMVLLAMAATVAVTHQQAFGAPPEKRGGDSRRVFYLTHDQFDGSQALNACAAGFHMASMWEISEPSNLKYDTTLGLTHDDSGSGPPAQTDGWIRTGMPVDPSQAANCLAYTTNTGQSGTVMWLSLPALFNDTNIWKAATLFCSRRQRVWCVQD